MVKSMEIKKKNFLNITFHHSKNVLFTCILQNAYIKLIWKSCAAQIVLLASNITIMTPQMHYALLQNSCAHCCKFSQ
jgi:hypothetical protein